MSKTTKLGLKLLAVSSPFEDYFGTILDLAGDWTVEMIEKHGEDFEDQPTGLAVWEGSSEVDSDLAGEDADYREYKFVGAWRRPTTIEGSRLIEGLMPFTGMPMPAQGAEIEVSE